MTIKELLREVLKEKYDQKGLQVYVRDGKGGCWKADNITVEDSGVYILQGDESNPQPVANGGEVQIDEHVVIDSDDIDGEN